MDKLLKKRKAQLTIFIIVGIILLFSTGMVLFVRQQMTRRAEFVSPELVPLKNYVEQCMENLAEEAVFLAESQGGYVEIPDTIAANPLAYLDGPIKIPYWFYGGRSRIPEPGDIESAIGAHVDKYLLECVGNFDEFKEFNVSIVALPSTTVAMSDRMVDLSTEFEIDVTKISDQSISKIRRFSTFMDSSLGKLYEMAARIMIIEENTGFLEDAVMEMIAASDLPNMGGEMTCENRQWSIQDDIIPTVQALLVANFHYMLFDKTWRDRAYPYSGEQEEWNDYFNKGKTGFLISLGTSKFKDIEANLVYNPAWDFFLDVTPKKGDTVKPVGFNMPIITSCFKMYNHKYSIEFPLEFTLVDRSRLVPETFSFTTPVVIKESQAARGGYFEPSFEDTRFRQDDYCQRKEKAVTVRALDAWTNEPLTNVSITMQCVRFACDMGSTGVQYTELGLPVSMTNFMVKALVPECSGAVFVGRKEGYADGSEKDVDLGTYTLNGVDVNKDNVRVDISMMRLADYSPRFKIIEYSSSGSYKERSLKDDEKVVMSLRTRDSSYDRTFIYPSDELANPEKFQLLVNTMLYDLDIKLIKGSEYVGGYMGNFTTNGREVMDGGRISFNVIAYENSADKAKMFELMQEGSSKDELKPKLT